MDAKNEVSELVVPAMIPSIHFLIVLLYETLVAFDKITARINKLCYGLDNVHVEPIEM